ncbi:molybdenum cofactor guanylyltransferase [Demequina litorisediminis]|uniref:MobA-like NTP transferase domain-containing protein n=1 Tax=Demequina litorisediminis TaxID=1849022 RepID=A0ABQ6I8V7_9MICO|nr:NTP transferase domain-containing protein [Demequina litorisediminis]GMA34272.1 hypothetical protein GCM10025876_04760 [Demequina litorisediminis]
MNVDALVLAGGRATRLDGADKGALMVGGATLLERTLDAASGARTTVVVGPPEGVPAEVLTAREVPHHGGPVAAIAAGMAALPTPAADAVLVLACDMPYVADAVPVLLEAWHGDGAWAVDADGRTQPLLAVYDGATLRAAIASVGEVGGASMRRLTEGLAMVEVPVARAAADADTWEDVERLRKELS